MTAFYSTQISDFDECISQMDFRFHVRLDFRFLCFLILDFRSEWNSYSYLDFRRASRGNSNPRFPMSWSGDKTRISDEC